MRTTAIHTRTMPARAAAGGRHRPRTADNPLAHVLHELLAAAPDALLVVDTAGQIVFANDQTSRLFGWSKEELVGRRIDMLLPVGVLDRDDALPSNSSAMPRPTLLGTGLPMAASRKDGTTFPAEISVSTLVERNGNSFELAGVRDVSDRMELALEAQRLALELAAERQRLALDAQREQSHRLESLGQLAGGVAHDFNNLLGVILNYHTLVARRVADPVASADLEQIRAAAERGAAMTRQLLMFARQDRARPEPLDVIGIISDAASMLRRTLGEQIELDLELTSEPLIAIADRYQLEQIVMNLAINARDAMGLGGRLTIAAEPSPGDDGQADAIIRVSDTGEGMSADVLAKAFEPFFTTKPRGQGTGLGLATVYGIVTQNGGTVDIESTVGVGTVVSVRLRGGIAPDIEPAAVFDLANGGQERVLLIEDEPDLRLATARLLGDHGYTVLVANDGVEALEVFDREKGLFDVVVTDVAMPRMRGDELAVHLRARCPDIRIIFMSGYASGDTALTGPLLSKPVAVEALLRMVREVLDH